jgi:hypothetical protein
LESCEAAATAAGKASLDALLLQGPPSPAPAGGGGGGAPRLAAASASLEQGVAVLGSASFQARARLLALSGWDLKLLTAAPLPPAAGEEQQAAPHQQAAPALPALVGPESAALLCALCSAKAGLWTFFPQCKPVVLAAPRPLGSGGQPLTTSVSRAAVSRNVAADMGTTIAGGTMQPAAGAAAAPFGASAQPAFGFGAPAPSPAQAVDQGTSPGTTSPQQADQTPSPFGRGSGSSLPVFGFAALQVASPAAAEGSTPRQQGGTVAPPKRKQPDFSWEAVMADIAAKEEAAKRSKVASSTPPSGGVPAPAAAPGGRQQVASAAAVAAKYQSAAPMQLDPLALHRPFCPWVNSTQASGPRRRGVGGWLAQRDAGCSPQPVSVCTR